PTWPALLVLALGAASLAALRGGANTAVLVGAGALVVEALPLIGRPISDMPTVLGLACAAGAVPVLVELFTRRARVDREQAVKDAVDQRLRALDEDARAYRLITSTLRGDLPLDIREQRRRVGSVQAIRESVYALLELTSRALGNPHTCALFLLDPTGKQLKVQELITRSDFVATGPVPADKGVLGTVCKKKDVLSLGNLKSDFQGVTWYHPPEQLSAIVAVPVMEGEHLRGVLLCDWKDEHAPGERETSVLRAVARQVVRTMETEQLFAVIDRDKQQTDRLYAASRRFIEAVTLEDTFKVALETARQVCDASVAVLALKEEGAIKVSAVDGLPPEHVGKAVVDDSGLITACMKNQVVLPHGVWEPERIRSVLGPEAPLPGMEAVRIVPFLEKNESVGVLVVAAQKKLAFPRDVDERLQVTADMAAMGVANARLYARMERMATTDGLTGLLNHRTFQERFSEVLKRASRYKRTVALILTDIDHFKNVNDTYGHPVGDEVIRRVASVLKTQIRTTDIVARYGGEEFAVVMDETDANGCLQMAERIRQAVSKEVVTTDMGPLKVTLSLGVAAYPTHGTEKHHIIERADQALYVAKHNGRNRAVIAAPPEGAPTAQPHAEKA
ncbi:MAG: diguanylate cyclase, partial [Myxococcota bacterium]